MRSVHDVRGRRSVYSNAAIALTSMVLVALIWSVVQERVAFEYRQAGTDVENDNANLSLLLESRTRGLIENVDQALHFVRRQYSAEGAAVRPAQIVEDMGIRSRAIRSITVIDAEGNVVAPRPLGTGVREADAAFFAELAADDQDSLHVGRTRPDAAGQWTMEAARPIINPDGTFGGAVVAAIDPAQLFAFYRETSLGTNDVMLLLGSDGFTRLRVSGQQLSFGQDLRASVAAREAPHAPVGVYRSPSTVDGVSRIFTYRALRSYPLVVVVGSAEQDAFASFRDHRRGYYQLAAVATIAVVVLALVLMRAVLRQRRAVDEILRNESRFRATFDQAFVGMAQSSGQGRMLQVNRRLCDITGYGEDELVGRPIVELVHPEDRPADDVVGARAPAERRLLRKDGRIAWANIATTPIPGGEGADDCLVTVVQDITEFKRVDMMKSEFVSIVSHELRTPLTSIRGSLGLIAGGVAGALPDGASRLIDIAKSNCERLIRLINDMLDTEKIESGRMSFDMREVDLVALVDGAMAANAAYASQRHVGLRRVASEPARVRADADRLTQVVTNLLSNAMKFSPEEADVEVAVMRRGPRARVEIRDHGAGIPAEFRDRIFQKFSQADSSDTRQKGGTGLGLNISKAIVERLGGEIGFETATGRGTVFHFELPAVDSGPSVAKQVDNGRPCVLVCEDDADIARLIAMLLDKAGYDADLSHTAAEARRKALSRQYIAATVDLKLPDEPGISLIRDLRREAATRELPVIVVSATAEAGRVELNGEALSVSDWLMKPIDENRLVAALRRAAEGRADEQPRILHVEDDPDIQRIAAAIAHDIASFEFAGSLAEARAMLARWRFDLVLLDLQLPDGSGWDLLPDVAASNPTPRVVVFSVHEVDSRQRQRVDAVLVKTETTNEVLLEAIRRSLRMSPRHRGS